MECVKTIKDKEQCKIIINHRLTNPLNVNGIKEPFITHDIIAGAVSFKVSGSRHLENFGKPGK